MTFQDENFENITATITYQDANFDNLEKQLQPLTLQANKNSITLNKQYIEILQCKHLMMNT